MFVDAGDFFVSIQSNLYLLPGLKEIYRPILYN